MTTYENQSATPILDLSAPLPRCEDDPLSRRDILILLAFVTILAVGWQYPPLEPFVWVIVTSFVVIAVHEAGHVIAGLLVGFRFKSVEVGPLRIELISGKLRTSLVDRLLSGGFTRMSLDRFRRVRRRWILYVAGGPTATFFTGAVALAVFYLFPTDHDSVAKVMLAWFGFYSILVGIGYLFVRRVGRHPSDSAQLWMLTRSRDRAEQLLAKLALELRRSKGDEDVELNERWISVAWGPADKVATGYRTNWDGYASKQDRCIAAVHLEYCLANSGFLQRANRDALIAEAATFTAWSRNDAAKARVWLERLVAPQNLSPLLRTRLEAAMHCAQGQFDDALALVERGLEMLSSLPRRRSVAKYEASWAEWRSQIQQRRDAAVGSSIPEQSVSISG